MPNRFSQLAPCLLLALTLLPPAFLPPGAAAQDKLGAAAQDISVPAGYFANPIAIGADPWVVKAPSGDGYLWCAATADNTALTIYTSDELTSMGQPHVIWEAPKSGPYSKEVWAPEFHHLDGRWYVYFAASDGQNANHLTYVLQSRTDDPLGEYTLHGPLATGEGKDGRSPNIWAIDVTVLEHANQRYAIWSGWDAPGTDRQFLYIAPMKNPLELGATRVRIASNDDFPWEITEPGPKGRGLNEGPEVLKTDKRTFVIYSCGASWLPTYKLGMLELVGDDPLQPSSWKKHDKPAFESTEETYGVGHSTFVQSSDKTQWWHVYHAKLSREPGWHRGIFLQSMRITDDGYPDFGKPLPAGKPLKKPSAELLEAVLQK